MKRPPEQTIGLLVVLIIPIVRSFSTGLFASCGKSGGFITGKVPAIGCKRWIYRLPLLSSRTALSIRAAPPGLVVVPYSFSRV